MIHEPLECRWRIRETKWHDAVSKATPWRDKRCFLLIFLRNANLKIARVTITYRVSLMACHFIQDFVLEWEREVIPLRRCIQGFIVDADSPFAILFWRHYHWRHPF